MVFRADMVSRAHTVYAGQMWDREFWLRVCYYGQKLFGRVKKRLRLRVASVKSQEVRL